MAPLPFARARRFGAGVAALAAVAAVTVSACGSSGSSAAAGGQAPAAAADAQLAQLRLAEGFDSVNATFDGQAAVALVPVDGDEVWYFGSPATDPTDPTATPTPAGTADPDGETIDFLSWSTMKPPLAIAALRDNGDAVSDLVDSAIRWSDNDATWQLWLSLGDRDTWVDKYDRVLRDAGDRRTKMRTDGFDDDDRSYGLSDWRLDDQALFAAGLPCLAEDDEAAATVYELMSEIDEDQSWGLGLIDGAHFKGGWGPGADQYLVRQFGVIETARGATAVAVAAAPTDNDHDTGTAMLDRIAGWLVAESDRLPAGRC